MFSTAVHPGIAPLRKHILTRSAIILVQDYSKHSMLSLSRFHAKTSISNPTLARGAGHGPKDLRLRFILYQLLQLTAYMHSQGLCLDPLHPGHIMLDDDMWVTLPVHFSARMCFSAECREVLQQRQGEAHRAIPPESQSHDMDRAETETGEEEGAPVEAESGTEEGQYSHGTVNEEDVPPSPPPSSPCEEQPLLEAIRLNCLRRRILLGETFVDRPLDFYEPLTLKWVTGKMSNFEYLLAINHAAGRSMADPLYHPVLPWVTDFTAPYEAGQMVSEPAVTISTRSVLDGKYLSKKEVVQESRRRLPAHMRDLTRTKFRLSKGDAQLHTTFKHSDPPHHIPETLSELTYYIYMARCTPMQVLRRIVRSDFVAEHYPHSMTRMFYWTPDECIPEFYSDPSMFRSIHKDAGLQDIELPYFTPTIEDFLRYHRSVLESDEVSDNLHHWIDLTFGHLLRGEAAATHLNVPLVHTMSVAEQAGDSPNLDKHPGFVVLFNTPHPRRNSFNSVPHTMQAAESAVFDDQLQSLLSLDTSSTVNKKTIIFGGDEASSGEGPMTGGSGRLFLSKGRPDPTLSLLTSAKAVKCGHFEESQQKWDCGEAMKFSARYGAYLEPCYQIPHAIVELRRDMKKEDPPTLTKPYAAWDQDFRSQVLRNAEVHDDAREEMFADLTSAEEGDAVDPAACIHMLQAQDMLSIGCIAMEILTGTPVFSREQLQDTLREEDVLSSLRTCMTESVPIPVGLRRVISLLLNPDPAKRPTAAELLGACGAMDLDTVMQQHIYNDDDSDEDDSFAALPDKGVAQFAPCRPKEFHSASSRSRKELLEDFCGNIFPTLFPRVYAFIGRLKVAPTSRARLSEVVNNIHDLSNIPLEGISLTLPHLLAVIADPQPFRDDEEENPSSHDKRLRQGKTTSPLILEYATIVDILGERLGMDAAEKILIPAIVDFLSKLNSPKLLRTLLLSTLWRVIIFRSGPQCFLRQFLPLLLTYVSCGTLQNVSRNSSVYVPAGPGEGTALWAYGGLHIDQADWLHRSPSIGLREVQQSAVIAVVNLAGPDSLGPGLCVRYVLPALLCLFGIPQLAATGFGLGMEDEGEALGSEESVVETERDLHGSKGLPLKGVCPFTSSCAMYI